MGLLDGGGQVNGETPQPHGGRPVEVILADLSVVDWSVADLLVSGRATETALLMCLARLLAPCRRPGWHAPASMHGLASGVSP